MAMLDLVRQVGVAFDPHLPDALKYIEQNDPDPLVARAAREFSDSLEQRELDRWFEASMRVERDPEAPVAAGRAAAGWARLRSAR